MTQSELNKEYGKLLARWLYELGIDKLPVILNTEQYESFVEERKKINKKREI